MESRRLSEVEAVSARFSKLANESGKAKLVTADNATVFDAQQEPGIAIGKYFTSLMRSCDCSEECAVIALIYVTRSGVALTRMNAHRLVLGCLILAIKNRDDRFYSNAVYARMGGVHVAEVVRLCKELLTVMDWRLYVGMTEYRRTLDQCRTAVAPLTHAVMFEGVPVAVEEGDELVDATEGSSDDGTPPSSGLSPVENPRSFAACKRLSFTSAVSDSPDLLARSSHRKSSVGQLLQKIYTSLNL